MDVKEVLKIRIKELRKIMDMTQEEFSDFIGTTQQTLSGYENGKTSPSVEVLVDIAKKCNVSIDWLCGLSDTKNYDIETYSDVCKLLFDITNYINVDIRIVGFDNPHPTNEYEMTLNEYGLFFSDYEMIVFLEKWKKVKNLYDDQTIDFETYKSVVNSLIDNHNVPIGGPFL